MEFFVGLDVSLDETYLCVLDEGGSIGKEGVGRIVTGLVVRDRFRERLLWLPPVMQEASDPVGV